jgi:hypothetical protein
LKTLQRIQTSLATCVEGISDAQKQRGDQLSRTLGGERPVKAHAYDIIKALWIQQPTSPLVDEVEELTKLGLRHGVCGETTAPSLRPKLRIVARTEDPRLWRAAEQRRPPRDWQVATSEAVRAKNPPQPLQAAEQAGFEESVQFDQLAAVDIFTPCTAC